MRITKYEYQGTATWLQTCLTRMVGGLIGAGVIGYVLSHVLHLLRGIGAHVMAALLR